LAAVTLGIISSAGAMNSFAQNELTTTDSASAQNQESNAISTASFGNPFFQDLGRIIGQRVLAIMPQPQLEFSFMANANLDNGSRNIINAINTGTSVHPQKWAS
jgi:hypothetical protein